MKNNYFMMQYYVIKYGDLMTLIMTIYYLYIILSTSDVVFVIHSVI